jgi:SulP family sulfate permease
MAGKAIARVFPFVNWFEGYSSSHLKADFVAGVTVALVIVPQSMAYAQLAGLPPYYGLYAALLPPVIGVMFGSSALLATGPVAIVSLMTSAALAPLAKAGTEGFIAYAVLLALMIGIFQLLLGVLRLGLLVNFLSHPVVNGFTNAAALVIATSQLPQLFGIQIDSSPHHYETVIQVFQTALEHIHWPTLGMAALAMLIMSGLKIVSPRVPYVLVAVSLAAFLSWFLHFEDNRTVDLEQIRDPEIVDAIREYNAATVETDQLMARRVELSARMKSLSQEDDLIESNAEMAKLIASLRVLEAKSSQLRHQIRDHWFAAVEGSEGKYDFVPDRLRSGEQIGRKFATWRISVSNGELEERAIKMIGGGSVVGDIPQGLPAFSFPKIELGVAIDLFPMAIVISVLGFMEAISIAKRIASATGKKLDPNQELIGQGLANIGGSFFQSYAVSGSFSRSALNFQTGAVTGFAMLFSSAFVLLTLLFLTPLLYYLPRSVLAAVIMMAVFNLINIRGFIHAWKAQRYDGIISVITFFTTFFAAPHLEIGIVTGVILSTTLFLYRTMRPNWWLISRSQDGAFRRADQWNLETCRHVAVLAFNRSIVFANVNHLEEALETIVRTMPNLQHILIVGYAINELDASGEVTLSMLVSRLRTGGVDISFCGLNDHVLGVMHRTGLDEKIGKDHIYPSVAHAIESIHKGSCIRSGVSCPLVEPRAAYKSKTISPKSVSPSERSR